MTIDEKAARTARAVFAQRISLGSAPSDAFDFALQKYVVAASYHSDLTEATRRARERMMDSRKKAE